MPRGFLFRYVLQFRQHTPILFLVSYQALSGAIEMIDAILNDPTGILGMFAAIFTFGAVLLVYTCYRAWREITGKE